MARVFLDANVFIDLVEKRKHITPGQFSAHDVFVSALSVHILLYITKRKIPYPCLTELLQTLTLVPVTELFVQKALENPTKDFEDNIQLHSAVEADCEMFLTADKKLLKLGSFGKTKIASSMPQ